MAAGNDGKVMFYDTDGGVERTFDYGIDKQCKVPNTRVLFLLWCLYAHSLSLSNIFDIVCCCCTGIHRSSL